MRIKLVVCNIFLASHTRNLECNPSKVHPDPCYIPLSVLPIVEISAALE